MTLLDSNLKAFEIRYPSQASFLKKTSQEFKGLSRPLIDTRTLKVDESLQFTRLVILFGIGDGEFLFQLSQKRHPQTYVIVIERSSDVLLEIFRKRDCQPLISHPFISWFVGTEVDYFNSFFNAFHNLDLLGAASGSTFFQMPYTQEDLAAYEKIQNIIEFAVQRRMRAFAALPEDSYRGFLNVVRNLNRIPEMSLLNEWKDSCANLPGIVVSAGPSLNRSLDLLKKYQDRVVIFCVDAVFKVLLNEGIMPDFVACLERTPETTLFFSDLPANVTTCLVGSPLLSPETLDVYPGLKRMLLQGGFGQNFFMPDFEYADLGGCSSTMAYWGLHLLGCNPILFLGQDLAYDRHSDRSHADGVLSFIQEEGKRNYAEIKKKSAEHPACWTEGNDGQPILSNEVYITFKESFERLIAASQKTCVNAIARQDGARIKGAFQAEPFQAFERFVAPVTQVKPKLSADFIKKTEAKLLESLKAQRIKGLFYLNDQLIPSILKQLNTISLYFQYHMPILDTSELKKEYTNFFLELEVKDYELIGLNPFLFDTLLTPFMCMTRIRMRARCFELLQTPGEFLPKITPLLILYQDYYRDLIYWAMRVQDLLHQSEEGSFS